MKLRHLFETENDLGFDEKYTREDNPEVFMRRIALTRKNLSSFEGFPKLLPAGAEVRINGNAFTSFEGFPTIKHDELRYFSNLR
jgi:hypothetical protein